MTTKTKRSYNPLQAPPPVDYFPAPGIGFLTSKIRDDSETKRLGLLDWTRVTKGSAQHLKHTVCCDQKCRIGDIIVIVPIYTMIRPDDPGPVFVHVGCLRDFLEEVPDVMNVIKEHVQEIKAKFEE